MSDETNPDDTDRDDTDRKESMKTYAKLISAFLGMLIGVGVGLGVVLLLPDLPVLGDVLIVASGLVAGFLVGLRYAVMIDLIYGILSFFT